MNGSGLPSAPSSSFSLAEAGAISRPSMVASVPVAASWWSSSPPPPIPELCGSTTVSASIIAMAASAADPPLRRISCPAAVARGSAEETTPLPSGAVAEVSAGGALCALQAIESEDKASAAAATKVRGMKLMPSVIPPWCDAASTASGSQDLPRSRGSPTRPELLVEEERDRVDHRFDDREAAGDLDRPGKGIGDRKAHGEVHREIAQGLGKIAGHRKLLSGEQKY